VRILSLSHFLEAKETGDYILLASYVWKYLKDVFGGLDVKR
jgi:hypothetical protein